MNVDYKLIGGRIKAERKKLGITQEVLAEKLDVSIGYVSQIERGITKISLDLLAAVSTILKCNISDFISESAIASGNYMSDEIMREIQSLDAKKRKLLLDFIKFLEDI